MSTPPDDAQRTMEQTALRNVRSLVDKLETTEELEGKALRKQVVVIVVSVLVVCAIAFIAWQLKAPPEAPRTVVIPPPTNVSK